MTITRSSKAVLATFLLAASVAPALTAGEPGITLSHVHLDAWQPDFLAPNASYGYDVALEGRFAAVSSSSPSLVVTYEQVDGLWTEGQVLTSPTGPDDLFGSALDLEGGRLFVGAARDDVLAENSGALHIYERIDEVWTLVQTLRDDTPTVDGLLGTDAIASGEWLGVSAPQDDVQGTIHMFARIGGVYERVDVLSNPWVWVFGYDFHLRARPGEQTVDVFVGDFNSDVIAQNGGIVWPYVVALDGTTSYGPLISSDVQPGDYFGSHMAFDGEQLFVSATQDDDVAPDAGAVYVFDVDLEGLTPTIDEAYKILPTDAAAGERFGMQVLLEDGLLAIRGRGMYAQEDPAYFNLYLPAIFGNGWNLDDRMMAADWQENDVFGADVDMDAGRLLVGASSKHGYAHRIGGAYMFSTLAKTEMSGFSPSPYLAQTETYGEGKPGQMGVPVLSATSAAVPGQILVVGLTNVPIGAAPVLFWGPNPANLPFDGGMLLVANPIVTTLPVVGQFGQVGIGGTVPDDLALCGVSVHLQAMFVDEGAAGAHQTAQTNGLKVTVGY